MCSRVSLIQTFVGETVVRLLPSTRSHSALDAEGIIRFKGKSLREEMDETITQLLAEAGHESSCEKSAADVLQQNLPAGASLQTG